MDLSMAELVTPNGGLVYGILPNFGGKKHSNRFRILPRNGLESQISNHM